MTRVSLHACWQVCWRPLLEGTCYERIKRGDRIEKFKQHYNSCPMQQILRNICSLEERRHSLNSREGTRLSTIGRVRHVKLEPSQGYQEATTEQMSWADLC